MKTTSRYALLFTMLGAFALSGCEQAPDENISQWPLIQNCDLHQQACESKMGDAKAILKISPHPIPIAKPLGIEVELQNLQVEKLELDISGINMYMGYNRVNLISTKPGHYVGTSMLAFCTTQKMEWQITLIAHLADGSQIQIPYQLVTVNR